MAVSQINVGFQVNVKELAEKLNQAAIELEKHKKKFTEVGNSIGQAGQYIGRYVDQMAGTVVTTIGGVVAFVPEIISGFSKLNAFLIANPWVAAATAIAAAGAALYLYTKRGTEAAQIQRMLNDVNNEALKNTAKERAELESLIQVAKDDNNLRKDRLDAIKKLNEISPKYLGNITLETINTKKAKDAIDDYVSALNSKAREQALASKRTELYQKQIEDESKVIQHFQPVADGLARVFKGQEGVVISTREELEDYIKTLKITEVQANQFRSAYERQLRVLEEGRAKFQNKVNILDNYAKAQRGATDAERDASKETISYYEEQIKHFQKLQKETAKTPEQFKAYQTEIDKYKSKIAEIDGGGKTKVNSRNLENIKLETIKFYESQISALKKYQEEEVTTAEDFAKVAEKIKEIQQKIDSITGKRNRDVSISIEDYSPAIEGSTVALERQLQVKRASLELDRLRFGEGSAQYKALEREIKDLEFTITANVDSSGFNTAVFEKSLQSYKAGIDGLSKASEQIATQEKERAQEYAQVVGDVFGAMGSSVSSAMGQSEDALTQFGGKLVEIGLKSMAIAMSQSAADSVVVATQASKGMGVVGLYALPALISAAMGFVMSAHSKVPKFADGGVVFGPVLGLMGEYAGASSNPEVIAPLNKLREMIEPAGGGITQITLGGGFTLRGNDLQLVLDRNKTRSKRIG
ncbi:hypothetical protein HX049_08005 [Myroides odoratimimus]|uniref:hypothetical protein n=1 Tax=Myroides odoratimimus TaxID=76832 RepID=UPI00257707C7|nr:hypothetical protein [Myroides odoratimimus]MDM1397117.1 hypothetical protein [Myroides odoratimimus]